MTFRTSLTAVVVSIALTGVLVSPALAQDPAPEAEAKSEADDTAMAEAAADLDADLEALRDHALLITELEKRLSLADEATKGVVQDHLDEERISLLDGAIAVADKILVQEEAGADVGEHRQRAGEWLRTLPAQTRDAADRIISRISPPDEKQSAVEQSAYGAKIESAIADLDRLFTIQIEGLDLARRYGLDMSEDEAWLKRRVVGRAHSGSILLRISSDSVDVLRAQVAMLPEDAELKAKLAVAEARETAVADGLQSTVNMMRSLDLPRAEFEKQLIATTGEITTVDAEVIGGLIADWSRVAWRAIQDRGPPLLVQLVLFAGIVFAFYQLARILQWIVNRGLASPNVRLSELLKRMISAAVKNLVVLVGVLVALSQLGITLGPVLAGLGIAGFVVGFALQDALSNFASGMFILLYRPFDMGDVVEAGGVFGKVSHTSLVSTTILTFDNQTIVVPNNKIWGDVIKNVTAQKVRRVDLVFGISYDDDVDKAEGILQSIVGDHEKVLPEPAPLIKLNELADSSVNFIVRPWVRTEDYWDVFWDLTKSVKLGFDAEGISIPYPQQDVHLPKDGSD